MEAIVQSSKRQGYLWWLVVIGFGAALLLTRLSMKEPIPPSAEGPRLGEGDAEFKAQLDRLERQVVQLRSQNQALATKSALVAPSNGPSTEARPEQEEQPKDAEDGELSELRLQEESAQNTEKRYALLEQRFTGEPFDASSKAPEEHTVRERIASLQGYELSKIECRSTMCRLEVKADGASAEGMIFRLGFKEGGRVRRRPDGSFLLFAGRDGFPFHETNDVE